VTNASYFKCNQQSEIIVHTELQNSGTFVMVNIWKSINRFKKVFNL